MADWATLERQAPAIAAAGRRLLWVPGVGVGYLATVGRDGSPRVHPINLLIVHGSLHAFVVPSPKLADLQRDGRYALHSTGSADVNDEFSIRGHATPAPDTRRADAAAAAGSEVGADHVLFELGIDHALWAEYATPPRWPPTYHRWRSG